MGNYNVVGSGTTNGWRKIMQKGIAIESMCVRKATPKCQLRKMTNAQKKLYGLSHRTMLHAQGTLGRLGIPSSRSPRNHNEIQQIVIGRCAINPIELHWVECVNDLLFFSCSIRFCWIFFSPFIISLCDRIAVSSNRIACNYFWCLSECPKCTHNTLYLCVVCYVHIESDLFSDVSLQLQQLVGVG